MHEPQLHTSANSVSHVCQRTCHHLSQSVSEEWSRQGSTRTMSKQRRDMTITVRVVAAPAPARLAIWHVAAVALCGIPDISVGAQLNQTPQNWRAAVASQR